MAKLYYIGKDLNANDLTHWKYIKREKVNGKWRYYYKDDATGRDTYVKNPTLKTKVTAAVQDKLGYDEREAAVNAINASNKADSDRSRAYKTTKYLEKRRDQAIADGRNISADQNRSMREQAEQARAVTKKSVEMDAKARAVVKKYAKTPLGALEVSAALVSAATDMVKKVAKKPVSAIKKAAEKGKDVANTLKALAQARKITKNVKPTTVRYTNKWGTFSKTRGK